MNFCGAAPTDKSVHLCVKEEAHEGKHRAAIGFEWWHRFTCHNEYILGIAVQGGRPEVIIHATCINDQIAAELVYILNYKDEHKCPANVVPSGPPLKESTAPDATQNSPNSPSTALRPKNEQRKPNSSRSAKTSQKLTG